MDVIVPTALKSLATAGTAIKEFGAWRKRARGDARALISELKDNMSYLDMVARDGVNLGDVVHKLSDREFKRLSHAGYNFNSLKRGKIAGHVSFTGRNLASWVGKDTDELVISIYDKIGEIKIRYPHVSANRNYRWMVRVNNIRKRIWLLLRHVRN
jgi:hypothetical protein